MASETVYCGYVGNIYFELTEVFNRAEPKVLQEYRQIDLTDLPLRAAHERICKLAERVLPTGPSEAQPHADAE